jgi:hypothetical protein
VGAPDGVHPFGALRPLLHVEHHPGDDLAEAEGDDGQIVAAQAEGGGAEEDAEQGGDEHGEEHRPPEILQEAQGVPGDELDRRDGGGEERRRVGPDGEKCGVPQVEQPGVADDDVQPHRQQDEQHDGDHRPHRLPAEELVEDRVDEDDRQHAEEAQQTRAALARLALVHRRAPRRGPRPAAVSLTPGLRRPGRAARTA